MNLKCLRTWISAALITVSHLSTNTQGYQTSDNMSPSRSGNFDRNWEKDPILPTDTVPVRYDLTLYPDLENGTFSGNVDIKIDVTKSRNYLLLHSHELDITETELFNENGNKIEVVDSFVFLENQFWVILLDDSILPGKYELKLNFTGSLVNKIVGFYRSSYTATDGSKRYLATTKFEPTYARKAFPCFDEPRYKAEYVIHLIKPSGNEYIALSNMNKVNEEPDVPLVGVTKVNFAPTPPMSTYLACFIVCDFEHLDPVYTSQGTPITVYSRPGQLNKTEFSRNIAKKAMDYFINYFNIEYPLPKLDLIAIPDFVSGAMENWGLITFRETRILISPEDSISAHEATGNTVTHELAHMWFGDLVTMAWWDDLWLNEGFATFLAQLVVDIIADNLYSGLDFIYSSVQSVLEDDSAEASHPIIQPVNHPDQITEIFDAISYNKGSSVIRMFESYNPKAFQAAVTKYLNKYKFKNAVTDNLWAEIESEYGIANMTRMLNTWTKQKGYPLISVKREGDKLVLKQNRFLSESTTPFDPNDSPFHYKWDVPIMYVASNEPNVVNKTIFKLENNDFAIDLTPGTQWFKLNSKEFGFYRVNYTEDVWRGFLSLLRSQDLNVEDRANLIDDAFALAKGGYLSYEIPFQLVSYLKDGTEKDFLPWLVASKHLNRYKNFLYGTPAYEKIMEFGLSLLTKAVSDDTWKAKTLTEETLLSFACRMEMPLVLAKANEIFVDWLEGETPKPVSNIRALVYKYGVRGSNETVNRKKLWELYLNESDAIERSNYMIAIASVNNPQMMGELLELMKNEDNVRSQDYFLFLMYMCQTPEGAEFVWNYLRNNWDYYVKRFTLNNRSLGLILPRAAVYFSTEEKLKEVEDFIKMYPEAGAGVAGRKKALETIRNNIKWRKEHYKNIEQSLNNLK